MSDITTAVIMAAGRGTRLAPLTDDTPKPMLRVAGRPIIEHTLYALPETVRDVLLVVGYRQDAIRNHFGAHWDRFRIEYVEQPELNGTAGAVHACRERLFGARFLVLNGDGLYAPADLAELCRHEQAVLGYRVAEAGRFDTLGVREDGTFSGLQGPVADGLVNTGAYVLDERFFGFPPARIAPGSREFGLPHTLAAMAETVPIRIQEASFWFPIGFPDDLAQADVLLRAGHAA